MSPGPRRLVALLLALLLALLGGPGVVPGALAHAPEAPRLPPALCGDPDHAAGPEAAAEGGDLPCASGPHCPCCLVLARALPAPPAAVPAALAATAPVPPAALPARAAPPSAPPPPARAPPA